jgi:hypothetical protein
MALLSGGMRIVLTSNRFFTQGTSFPNGLFTA